MGLSQQVGEVDGGGAVARYFNRPLPTSGPGTTTGSPEHCRSFLHGSWLYAVTRLHSAQYVNGSINSFSSLTPRPYRTWRLQRGPRSGMQVAVWRSGALRHFERDQIFRIPTARCSVLSGKKDSVHHFITQSTCLVS